MARTNYRRGVEKERACMEALENAGYIPMRTAGSHGIFDCIAIGPTGIRLIQVKRVKKGNSWQGEYKDSKEQIDSLPRFPSVSYEFWVWEDSTGWIVREVL